MKKTIAIAFGLLLLLSLLFSNPVSPIESETPVPVKEGNLCYIDDNNAYIAATPHTLTADGYIYLNVTSKKLEGDIDFCFGFNNNLAYPKSLEIYDPKTEITPNELDLKPYYDDANYRVQFNYNSTSKIGETVYNSYVTIDQKTSIVNEKNQTVGSEWTPVLSQYFDVAYLDSKTVYWNTTKTTQWISIKDLNFEKKSFSFQGMDTWYLGNNVIEKNKEYYLRMWLTVVPTLEDVTHEFFVGLKQHDKSMEQAVKNNQFYYLDPWYNDGWQYRKSHIITYAAGAGTNYTVLPIHVYYGSGDDDGDSVYLNGKCRTDFGDIRFIDDNGTTVLDYWMEKKNNGANATFWVKIQDDLGSSNAEIYLYYGNTAATTASNGTNTFIFFDDFETGLDKWTTVGYCTTSTETVYEGTYSFEYYYNQLCYLYIGSLGYTNVAVHAFYYDKLTEQYEMAGLCAHGTSEGGYAQVHDVYSTTHYVYRLNWPYYTSNVARSVGWHEFCIRVYSGTREFVIDGNVQSITGSQNSINSIYLGACWDSNYEIGYIDACFVRKYVGSEPGHGDWGTEEVEGIEDDTWRTGWKYRKQLNITSASGAGANYTLRINVHYGSGPDYKEDVYLNGMCQIDFDDIRFTEDDGFTLLDYWMEEKTDADNAVFWVRIPGNLSAANQSIYLYYGKSGVSTISNGDNTFTFFDDFSGTSLDLSKWDIGSGSPSVSDGYVRLSEAWIKADDYYGGPHRQRQRFRTSGVTGYTQQQVCSIVNDAETQFIGCWHFGLSPNALFSTYSGSYTNTSGLSFSGNTWYTAEYGWESDQVLFYLDAILKANHTTNIPTSDYMKPRIMNTLSGWNLDVDWMFISKYVYPEPAFDDWGPVEERFNFPDDWQYRKSHTINSNANAGVNYPVRIKVYSTSGGDSGENVYLAGKCRSDFGDIRFADSSGWTLLDYWMEKKTATYALFWVEISANLTASGTTIYIYYGNPNATRADNPLDLDIFQIREYDFWSGYSPDITFFKNGASIISMDSYTPGPEPMGYGFVFIHADKNYLDGKKLQLYWRCYFSYSGARELGSVYVVGNTHLRSKTTNEFTDNDDIFHPVSDYTNIHPLALYNTGSGWSDWTLSTSDVLDLSEFSSDYVTILITGVMGWVAQTTGLDVDYMKVLDANDNLLKTFDFDESVVMEQTGTLHDYGLYRKHVSGYNPYGGWGQEQSNAPWYDFAFVSWGTQAYINSTNEVPYFTVNGTNYYTNTTATTELYLSENVSYYVHGLFEDTGRYNYCKNFWGDPTQPEYVYNNASYCDANYNYTAIFYKGHFWTYPCPICNNTHYVMYDNEGGTNSSNHIVDYHIHENMTFGRHDFVFLWMCEVGAESEIGAIDDTGHSWGMLASWMDLNGTELSSDGYDDPDGTDHCFISFENTSIDFCIPTKTEGNWNFGHFAYLFFEYALSGTFTINEALDAAAEDTCDGEKFGATELYTGYTHTWWNPQTEEWNNDTCYMRVYGDGGHMIPN